MARYNNRVLTFIKAPSAIQLENDLTKRSLLNDKMLDVISVNHVGSFWYAWFYRTLDDLTPRFIQSKPDKQKRGRKKAASK